MKKRFRDEYQDARLGDLRRSERLAELGMALAAFPQGSFPEVLGDSAELEAAYRFFGNPGVDADAVLEPHYRETRTRCAERGLVVVAHDTTDFVFRGDRRGLGRMRGRLERGFFGHFALAVSMDAWREPLGALRLETWVRADEKTPNKPARLRTDRESLRWSRGVADVERQLGEGQAVHVMDREADAYDLLAELIEGKRRFIVRASSDRKLVDGELLADAVEALDIVVTREVPLSERTRKAPPVQRGIHPARTARTATLAISATTVTMPRPNNQPKDLPKILTVHVVVVEERHPPAGEPPVSWLLYTTEPVTKPADLERIVDGYRARWRIEEFFKALKSGCAIEKRQLESRHALVNALATYIPIAWRVLRHRTLAHADGSRPASAVLTPVQLRILRHASAAKLPRAITVADAFVAVAALGGHLKRNGPPGWITLARGYERLLTLEQGVELAGEM